MNSLKEFTFVSRISEDYLCNQPKPLEERQRMDARGLAARTDNLIDFSVKKECHGLVDGCYETKFIVTNNTCDDN